MTKRKTNTSTSVKRRYNDKVYKSVSVMLPKDTVDAFRTKCTETGTSQRQVILKAVEEFIKN